MPSEGEILRKCVIVFLNEWISSCSFEWTKNEINFANDFFSNSIQVA